LITAKDAIRSRVLEVVRDNPRISGANVARQIAGEYPQFTWNTVRKEALAIIRELASSAPAPSGPAPDDEADGLEAPAYNDAGAPDTRDSFESTEAGYRFDLKGERVFELESQVVWDLVWWYTHQGDGLNARRCCTLAQERHDVYLTEHYARRIYRVLGVRKTSPPFTPTQLAKYTPEELNKRALARRQGAVEVVMRADAARQWRKLYETERRRKQGIEDAARLIAETHAELGRSTPITQPERCTDRVIAVCAAYDVHIGKLAGSHGTEDAVRDFIEAGQQLAARLLASDQQPERVLVVFGGDYFHFDKIESGKARSGFTTRGTPQDTDCTPREMLDAGARAARAYIDIMRRVAPVDVRIIRGNHDEMLTHVLELALRLAYEGCDDVSVTGTSETRQYVRHGSTLLGLEHGDGVKPSAVLGVMHADMRAETGRCEHLIWMHGHLHHQHMREVDGVLLVQVPSLAPADYWHKLKGYNTSSPAHAAYLIDHRDGLIGSMIARP
jgi:predicted phosphodiesterase